MTKMKTLMIIFVIFQVVEYWWNEIDRRKPNYSVKTCPSASLSTTCPIWTESEIETGPPPWEAGG
jgi:hypothetical protein